VNIIFLQRVLGRSIELLAFYFILSNIEGKSLKESFTELFFTKQKTLYSNIILLVVYPVIIALSIQLIPEYSTLIDILLRPVTAYFFVRLVFNIKKALLAFLLSMVLVAIVGAFSYAFSFSITIAFLLNFTIIIAIANQDYFEKIYIFLLKKNRLFNLISILSFILYIISAFTEGTSILSLLLLLILSLAIAIYLKNENRLEILAITNQINRAEYDEFIQLLETLSPKNTQNEVIHQYIIQDYTLIQIVPALSQKLEMYRRMRILRNYECIVTQKQIKINIVLENL